MTPDFAAPRVLVFDSGLGGLTVFAPIAAARPDAELIYVADDASFPYGELAERALVARVVAADGGTRWRRCAPISSSSPATPPRRWCWRRCASASRGFPSSARCPRSSRRRSPRAQNSSRCWRRPARSRATIPATLIREFAGDCEVTLVGSPRLAGLADAACAAKTVDDAEIAAEIAPGFVERDGRRTDQIVLACTHFPLLAERLAGAGAVAGRVRRSGPGDRAAGRRFAGPISERRPARGPPAMFTRGAAAPPALQKALLARGLTISSLG